MEPPDFVLSSVLVYVIMCISLSNFLNGFRVLKFNQG